MAGTEKWCQSKDNHKGAEAIKARDWCQKYHSELGFGGPNLCWLLLKLVSRTLSFFSPRDEKMADQNPNPDPNVIDIPDDEGEGGGLGGPVNIWQAREYCERIEEIFNEFTELLKEDKKDALEMTVRSLLDTKNLHIEKVHLDDLDVLDM